jgi:hypothetical protein
MHRHQTLRALAMDSLIRSQISYREEFPPARLATDEQRVRDWFDCLTETARSRGYSLAEIRAAVSIPATRLRVVLYRLGWKLRREAGLGFLTYHKPRTTPWPSDVEDGDSIVSKLRESP